MSSLLLKSWESRRKRDGTNVNLGMWTLENFGSSLSGISVALFTRGLGWTVQDLEIFLVEVRNEMKNTNFHAYWPM